MDNYFVLFLFAETPGYGGGYGKPEYGEYNVEFISEQGKSVYINHFIPYLKERCSYSAGQFLP
jgi:hypothetical protein